MEGARVVGPRAMAVSMAWTVGAGGAAGTRCPVQGRQGSERKGRLEPRKEAQSSDESRGKSVWQTGTGKEVEKKSGK